MERVLLWLFFTFLFLVVAVSAVPAGDKSYRSYCGVARSLLHPAVQ
jgi:hypothetical protein